MKGNNFIKMLASKDFFEEDYDYVYRSRSRSHSPRSRRDRGKQKKENIPAETAEVGQVCEYCTQIHQNLQQKLLDSILLPDS